MQWDVAVGPHYGVLSETLRVFSAADKTVPLQPVVIQAFGQQGDGRGTGTVQFQRDPAQPDNGGAYCAGNPGYKAVLTFAYTAVNP